MKKWYLLGVAMTICMSGLAQNVYNKLTSTPIDWAGTYLIVCEAQSVAFNGAANEENIDTQGGTAVVSVTIANNTITGSNTIDAATFTIAATDSVAWPWSIQSASGIYIGHKDTLDNGLSTETELKKKCMHQLSIDKDGDFIAIPRYEVNGPYNLQYNKKQQRFRYYVADDKLNVQLYKLNNSATAIDNTEHPTQSTKCLINGQVVILHNNKKFNLLGMEL